MGRLIARMAENAGLASATAASRDWRTQVYRVALAALGLHLLAAVLSAGFYHADEHFQILEFIHARLGLSPLSDLPIEYVRKIRPWLQPVIYGLISSPFADPFTAAGVCRLFSSLVGWTSSVALLLCAWRGIASQAGRRLAAAATVLLWYLPAFHARHSSENLGGSVFFLGLSLILLGSEWMGEGFMRVKQIPWGVALGGGVLMGLSFELRYQVGFMVLGAGLWLLLIARARVSVLGVFALGVFASIALGTGIDHWGYGDWTFAPWNYVKFNLVENHVSDTDTNPIWDFFRRALTETWPPLGFLTLVAFVIAWIRHPKHVATWCLVPLFLIHHVIGHKELRFLFPLAQAGPLLLALSLEPRKIWGVWARGVAWAIVGTDVVALLVQSVMPAWMPIRLYSFLYHYETQPVRLGLVGEGPYHILGNPLHFYRPPGFEQFSAPDFASLGRWVGEESGQVGKPTVLVLRNGFNLPAEMGGSARNCTARFRTLPKFLDRPELRHILENVKNWTVFECGV